MSLLIDHDGKSKTASAADTDHYPEPRDEGSAPPSEASIASRAYALWLEQGRPHGAAEANWLEAERELKTAAKSHSLIEKVHERAGSVQS